MGSQGIDGGRGYPYPGGHYNNWWWMKVHGAGGPENVTPEMLHEWINEMKGYMGW